MQLRRYGIYVQLCWPMRIVRIHSSSETCPRTWLPKIYIVEGMHWNLRFDGMSGLYLWDMYLYLCWLQAFFDCGLCSSVCIECVLGDGLDSIGGCEDRVGFGFGRWVIGLGVGKVMSVGLSSVSSGGYGYLRWLDWLWLRTVGMENYRGWIGSDRGDCWVSSGFGLGRFKIGFGYRGNLFWCCFVVFSWCFLCDWLESHSDFTTILTHTRKGKLNIP